MASELSMTGAALAGVLLLGAAVGAGWAFMDPVEPPRGEEQPPPQGTVWTRVFFEQSQTQYRTVAQEFPMDRELVFDPLRVAPANITEVTVKLHAELEGLALNDEFELFLRAPDGRENSAPYSGPLVNVNGYSINANLITWKRALVPTDATYETHDVDSALAWSAENHTNLGSTGEWGSSLQVSTPGTPGRSGNISLSFTFTHYEAVAALVDESRPAPTECMEGVESEEGEEGGDPADCPADDADDPQQGDRDAAYDRQVVPRTFISQTPVAVAVDRDPGPDGPL